MACAQPGEEPVERADENLEETRPKITYIPLHPLLFQGIKNSASKSSTKKNENVKRTSLLPLHPLLFQKPKSEVQTENSKTARKKLFPSSSNMKTIHKKDDSQRKFIYSTKITTKKEIQQKVVKNVQTFLRETNQSERNSQVNIVTRKAIPKMKLNNATLEESTLMEAEKADEIFSVKSCLKNNLFAKSSQKNLTKISPSMKGSTSDHRPRPSSLEKFKMDQDATESSYRDEQMYKIFDDSAKEVEKIKKELEGVLKSITRFEQNQQKRRKEIEFLLKPSNNYGTPKNNSSDLRRQVLKSNAKKNQDQCDPYQSFRTFSDVLETPKSVQRNATPKSAKSKQRANLSSKLSKEFQSLFAETPKRI